MTRPIEKGNRVHVIWDAHPLHKGKSFVHLQGEVLHTPSDIGDMWYVQDAETDEVVAINPQNSNLSTITKIKEV